MRGLGAISTGTEPAGGLQALLATSERISRLVLSSDTSIVHNTSFDGNNQIREKEECNRTDIYQRAVRYSPTVVEGYVHAGQHVPPMRVPLNLHYLVQEIVVIPGACGVHAYSRNCLQPARVSGVKRRSGWLVAMKTSMTRKRG